MALPLSIKATAQFPIVTDLPPEIASGIGKVVSAHAVVEHAVQHLLYHLMVAHAHVGRIAIAKRDPAVHMGSVKSLLSAWGKCYFVLPETVSSVVRLTHACCAVELAG
jgi:hypothetical protein